MPCKQLYSCCHSSELNAAPSAELTLALWPLQVNWRKQYQSIF